MKYEEFMKITRNWSFNDQVSLLMEDGEWCDLIMDFIRDNWVSNITLEHIAWFANDHHLLGATNLPEEEEEQ
jgi:hypothetical protein